MDMQMGMIGLGKMGMNMSRRLLKGRHRVVVYDRSAEKLVEAKRYGAATAASLEELAKKLKPPRVVWMMIPAGKPVDDMIGSLRAFLTRGDVLVDGGNSFYKDDIRRQNELAGSGIRYVDAGVSGGIWGLKEGYCIMAGGDRRTFRSVEPLIKTLAPPEGYLYCGPSGSGHFVKMVHNGIEYGMMAAYGEGFAVLNSSHYSEFLDFSKICRLWNRGSVIRSWLLELAEDAFRKDPRLSGIKGYVEDTGEGRWTVKQAIENAVPAPVIALSLFGRFRSREEESFADKVTAALRNEFGGHAVRRKSR